MQINTAVLISDPLIWVRVRQWLSDFQEICFVENLESENIDLIIIDHIPQADFQQCDWILFGGVYDQSILQNPFLFSAFDVIIEKDDLIRFQAAIDEFLSWKRALQREYSFTQGEMDLLRCRRTSWVQNQVLFYDRYDHVLFAQICQLFQMTADHWWTISEIAEELTVSKTTLRKYLEEMEKRNEVRVRMRYGKGRPSREYSIQKVLR